MAFQAASTPLAPRPTPSASAISSASSSAAAASSSTATARPGLVSDAQNFYGLFGDLKEREEASRRAGAAAVRPSLERLAALGFVTPQQQQLLQQQGQQGQGEDDAGEAPSLAQLIASDAARSRAAAPPATRAQELAALAAAERGGWPTLCASVELFALAAGWRVEERGCALSAAALAAAAGAAAAAAGPDVGAAAAAELRASAALAERAAALAPVADRNVYEKFRFMFSPLHERAAALAERLAEMAAAIEANAADAAAVAAAGEAVRAAGAAASPGAAPAAAVASAAAAAAAAALARAPGMSVGRVCLDGESGRLNAGSVALELPREGAGGGSERRLLDLHEVPGYGVFPGQVVGVRGTTPTGSKLIATEIFTNGAAPRAQAPLANAAALQRARAAGGPVRVWAAAGPFTSTADVAFEPLQKLLDDAKAASPPPDVIVLLGPFVDAEHPMSRSGVVELKDPASGQVLERNMTFAKVWSDVFLQYVELALGSPELAGTELVLINSPADVNADAVFPQWPLPRESLRFEADAVRPRIALLPNPATFVVGDLVFGATSVDTPLHLSFEDAWLKAEGAPASDTFARLARYMLEQRSYYPLYPAGGAAHGSAGAEAAALPLEVGRLAHVGMPVRPDVLLVPSRIGRPCARPVGVGAAGVSEDSTVVVNPGAAARGTKAGTIAKIAIFAGEPPAGGAAPGAPGAPEYVASGAATRVLVEIASLQAEG